MLAGKTPSATSPRPQSSGCCSARGRAVRCLRFLIRDGLFGRSLVLRFVRGMRPRSRTGRRTLLGELGDRHPVVRRRRVREQPAAPAGGGGAGGGAGGGGGGRRRPGAPAGGGGAPPPPGGGGPPPAGCLPRR